MASGYQELLDRAAACMGGGKKRALIVGGDNDAVLQSVAEWQGLSVVIVGDEKAIGDRMQRLGVALPTAEFLPAHGEDNIAEVAVSVASDADIIIKGQIHTDTFMRSMLSSASGLRGEGGGPGDVLCSHVFYMMSDDFPHPYFLSDGALNLSPTGAVGEAILTNMVALAERVTGEFPRVAVLSATESVNPKIASTVEAERLVEWGRREFSQPKSFSGRIFGPVALDIAVSPEAAAVKGYTHDSAGQANALLMPSLEAGNILFKSWVRYNNAVAGGLVVGAKAPIVLTSRSDSVASRLASLALAVIFSHAH